MEYRIDKERLLGVKASTKDIDLMVPEISEYDYLIDVIKQLGYKPVTGNGWSRDEVDFEDCLALMKSKSGEINMERLKARFRETASYDISEEKVNHKLELFLERLGKKG